MILSNYVAALPDRQANKTQCPQELAPPCCCHDLMDDMGTYATQADARQKQTDINTKPDCLCAATSEDSER